MRNCTLPSIFKIVLILILFTTSLQAQVYTRILGPGEQIADYIPWHINEKPAANPLSVPDVAAVLALDAATNPINRVAVKKKAWLTPEDGTFYTFGNYSIWKLTVKSPGATYLNFDFSYLNLPEGCQMIAYSDELNMIHGPITSTQFRDQSYVTDVVAGDEVTIEVFLPENTIEDFDFSINNFYYGIVRTMGGPVEKAYGQAGLCSPDISCPEGANWQLEADAVCTIIVNETTEACTGTLVTDECRTETPFILTAEHCITGPDSNPAVLRFRFKYQNISCGNTNGPSSALYVDYDGANFVSSFGDSDGALLELTQQISINDGLVYAGWNSIPSMPLNGTVIHHARGDAMKISFDSEPPVLNNNPINAGTISMPPGNAYETLFLDDVNDFGIVEPGSSGAPYFNENARVVATVSAGIPIGCGAENDVFFGRLSSFWTGGNTAPTSLAPWLSLNNMAQTTDSHGSIRIEGEDVVCNNDNYTLVNALPGSTVTWAVSPEGILAGSSTGTGVVANLTAQNVNNPGAAIITFTVVHPDCGTFTYTRDLWVGRPGIPVVNSPNCYEPNLNYYLSANAAGATSYTWSFPNCPFLPFDQKRCWENYSGNLPNVAVHAGEQLGSISVFAANRCGTRSINIPIKFCDDGGGGAGGPIIKSLEDRDYTDSKEINLSLYPNPVFDNSEIKLVWADISKKSSGEATVSIYAPSGKTVMAFNQYRSGSSIDISELPPSVYIVKAVIDGISVTRKVIKL